MLGLQGRRMRHLGWTAFWCSSMEDREENLFPQTEHSHAQSEHSLLSSAFTCISSCLFNKILWPQLKTAVLPSCTHEPCDPGDVICVFVRDTNHLQLLQDVLCFLLPHLPYHSAVCPIPCVQKHTAPIFHFDENAADSPKCFKVKTRPLNISCRC